MSCSLELASQFLDKALSILGNLVRFMNQLKRSRQAVSPAITVVAVVLVGLIAGGGAFFAEQAFAATPTPTLTVQTTNSQVNSLGSAQIQAQIQNGNPSSSYAVTIQVAVPTGAGGPFCDKVTVATGSTGSGQATVNFPDTGVPAALFTGAACSPAGKGGPSTIVAGTYTVTVSSVPAITTGTLSTSFTVVATQGVVTGSGTASSSTVKTYTGIPAPGGYQTCNGTAAGTPPTTSTLPATYETTATAIGSATFAGVISTNTPGQNQISTIYNPCLSATLGYTATDTYQVITLNDVTITLPSGGTVSGGLVIIETAAAQLTGAGTTTTTSINWDQMTLTGTGGLMGLTGTGTALVTAVIANGVSAATTSYWVELTNVPSASSGSGSTSQTGNFCGYYTQNGVQVAFSNLSQASAQALIQQFPPGASYPC